MARISPHESQQHGINMQSQSSFGADSDGFSEILLASRFAITENGEKTSGYYRSWSMRDLSTARLEGHECRLGLL